MPQAQLPDFSPCEGCEMPRACGAARQCAILHAAQEDTDMAATATAHLWLTLLEHAADPGEAREPHELRALCGRYTWRTDALARLADEGFLQRSGDRYYVDGSCRVPAKTTLGEINTALARRQARAINKAHTSCEGD